MLFYPSFPNKGQNYRRYVHENLAILSGMKGVEENLGRVDMDDMMDMGVT